jgi:hypothetical protein
MTTAGGSLRSFSWRALAGLFEDAWGRERRRRRWLLPLALLAAAAVFAVVLGGGGGAGSAKPGIRGFVRPVSIRLPSGPPRCGGIINSSTASLSHLHACGFTEIRLSSVTNLPGGGRSYNYRQPDGQVASIIQVPRRFNGTTVPRAEALAYGVPPAPPLNSVGYARWKRAFGGHYAVVRGPAYLVVPDGNTGGPTNQPQAQHKHRQLVRN